MRRVVSKAFLELYGVDGILEWYEWLIYLLFVDDFSKTTQSGSKYDGFRALFNE